MFEGKLIFAGGTTGGHLFPGVAVAEEWRRRHPRSKILFAGSGSPLEQQTFDPRSSSLPFEYVSLPVASSTLLVRQPLRFLMQNARALLSARRLIAREKPIGVIGLGGFASFPVVKIAQRRGIPTLLLEQNSIAGRTTRWLCKKATALCLSYDPTLHLTAKHARAHLTGNPLRAAMTPGSVAPLLSQSLTVGKMLSSTSTSKLDNSPLLLILGGSQGARGLNDLVLKVVKHFQNQLSNWRILHQTGKDDLEKVEQAYRQLGLNAQVAPFVTDLAPYYAQAELAFSRAGATTLAELSCFGIPAVLVPYPHSADGHQQENAARFAAAGAALVIPQESPLPLDRDKLQPGNSGAAIHAMSEMFLNPTRRAQMSAAMQSLARPHATAAVADLLESILQEHVRNNR